jgi:hypothetical protein
MLGRREVMGFALAPLPVLGPLLLGFVAILFAHPPSDGGSAIDAMLQLILMGYGATLVIGLPVHLVLRWRRRSSLSAYLGLTVLSIAFIGGAFAVSDRFFPPVPDTNPFRLHMWSRFGIGVTLAFAIAAGLSASVFWRVAVRQRRL